MRFGLNALTPERQGEGKQSILNLVGGFRLLAVVATLLLGSGTALAQEQRPPAEALIQRGLRALQQRDIPAAQGLLESALEESPEEARAWIALAQVYRILNLHEQARRHVAQAARFGEDDPLIQHALAMFYSDYGNWAEAAKWEERFARSERGDRDAFLRTVSLYLQADMPLKATEVGTAALERGTSPELHNALGKAFTMAGQLEAGIRHLKLAVEADPYEESLHYDLGHFYLRQLDFEAATQAFLAGRDYFDKSTAIELGLGIAAYGQRSFSQAVDHFLRASELSPDMEQPHAFLGRLLQHAGNRIEEVTERMRLFHQRQPENPLGPFLYGQVLLSRIGARNDPEALQTAEDLLRESIKRKDDFWESHYELGVLLEKKREYDAAETHLIRAVELNPDASKPHYRLARVYQRLGKSKDAKRERDLHKTIAERERQLMQGGLPGDLAQQP